MQNDSAATHECVAASVDVAQQREAEDVSFYNPEPLIETLFEDDVGVGGHQESLQAQQNPSASSSSPGDRFAASSSSPNPLGACPTAWPRHASPWRRTLPIPIDEPNQAKRIFL